MASNTFTRENLDDLIKDLLGVSDIPFQIKRQIRDFIERGFNYKGIARALCYLVDQKGLDLVASYKQYGIGIVKNVYQEANEYFDELGRKQKAQQQKQQTIIKSQSVEQRTIKCGVGDANQQIKKPKIDISTL